MLPTDPAGRKRIPLMTGCIDYFPDALAAVAAVSLAGNDQHNPGSPLHWDRSKSKDHADSCVRHLVDRGKLDSDGHRHSAKAAWRALALLQTEIEASSKVSEPSRHPAWGEVLRLEEQAREKWSEHVDRALKQRIPRAHIGTQG